MSSVEDFLNNMRVDGFSEAQVGTKDFVSFKIYYLGELIWSALVRNMKNISEDTFKKEVKKTVKEVFLTQKGPVKDCFNKFCKKNSLHTIVAMSNDKIRKRFIENLDNDFEIKIKIN